VKEFTTKWYLRFFTVALTVVGVLVYWQARSSLAGSREFNQWLGITSSNKTWLWLLCMIVIGYCIGFIIYKKVVKKNGRTKPTNSTDTNNT